MAKEHKFWQRKNEKQSRLANVLSTFCRYKMQNNCTKGQTKPLYGGNILCMQRLQKLFHIKIMECYDKS